MYPIQTQDFSSYNSNFNPQLLESMNGDPKRCRGVAKQHTNLPFFILE